MAVSHLKIYFGDLIKKHLKSSNVRQVDLADALHISPSAVSQMLSGKMTPNIGQLDIIMSKLLLERNDCAELRDCLARIRSGDVDLRSPLNEFIKSERTRQGLSAADLSELTGIDEETIFTLENRVNVQPTPHEAVRLAAVLGCEVHELWQFSPETVIAPGGAELPGGMAVMRENAAEYRSEGKMTVKIPIVDFETLKNINGSKEHLLDAAWHHMIGVVDGQVSGLVHVKARGSEFGWADIYEVILEIAETGQWLPGMTVLGSVNGELVLGSAAEKKNFLKLPGGEDLLLCQWFWLVNSFRFSSELFMAMKHNEVSRGKGQVAVFRSGTKKD